MNSSVKNAGVGISFVLLLLLSVTTSGVGVSADNNAVEKSNIVSTGTECIDSVQQELTAETKQCLSQAHSPIIHFHPDEQYRPTSVGEFVREAEIEKGSAGFNDNASLETIAGRGEDYHLILDDSEDYTEYGNDGLPRVVYSHVTKTEYGSGLENEYIAITYWMFYFHDPKKEEDFFIFQHQADFESVTVLINNNGPQYIAGSQHYGGERRSWTTIKSEASHPHIYPAQGAHSVYFVNTESFDSHIIGQEQHKEPLSASTDPVWNQYIEPQYVDYTGNGTTWKTTVETERYDRKSYEIVLLDGSEPWQEYRGSFTGSDIKDTLSDRSLAPTHRNRWSNPGEWVGSLPSHSKIIRPTVDWDLTGVVPWLRGSVEDSNATVQVRVWNNGAAPGTIYVQARAQDLSGNTLGSKNIILERKARDRLDFFKDTSTVHMNLSQPSDKVRVTVSVYAQPSRNSTEPTSEVTTILCGKNNILCGI